MGVGEGVRFAVVRPGDVDDVGQTGCCERRRGLVEAAVAAPRPLGASAPMPAVTSVSYTSLAAYGRCPYRFYAERGLGLAPAESRASTGAQREEAVLDAAARGTLVHALLERLDFRRPVLPTADAIRTAAPREPSAAEVEEIRTLVKRFTSSAVPRRLGRATRVMREQRFGFLHEQLLITGAFDVIAIEPEGRTLVVDYKSDRLAAEDPAAVVSREYATQQLIYALAALRAGASEVEVVHVFLEAPESPVSVTFTGEQARELEVSLSERTRGLRERHYPVTETPHRGVCHGCPAEGGLCSWPLEMTRRTALDRLF
jgi:RecB family exonuclease